MLKAVILIDGPSKGTRFRPLSLDVPKPLFPVAGLPIVQHHIDACYCLGQQQESENCIISNKYRVAEVLLLGYYGDDELAATQVTHLCVLGYILLNHIFVYHLLSLYFLPA